MEGWAGGINKFIHLMVGELAMPNYLPCQSFHLNVSPIVSFIVFFKPHHLAETVQQHLFVEILPAILSSPKSHHS